MNMESHFENYHAFHSNARCQGRATTGYRVINLEFRYRYHKSHHSYRATKKLPYTATQNSPNNIIKGANSLLLIVSSLKTIDQFSYTYMSPSAKKMYARLFMTPQTRWFHCSASINNTFLLLLF